MNLSFQIGKDQAVEQVGVCPDCAGRRFIGSAFCMRCGGTGTVSAEAAGRAVAPPKKSKKKRA